MNQRWKIEWHQGGHSFLFGESAHDACVKAKRNTADIKSSQVARMENAAEALYNRYNRDSLFVVPYESSSENQKNFWRELVQVVHETLS